jgi:DNA-binding XRE family transcriptional regulator
MRNNLKEIRQEQGLAILGVAVFAHTAPSTIVAIEKYGYVPGMSVKKRIASVLGVEVQSIWPTEGNDRPEQP